MFCSSRVSILILLSLWASLGASGVQNGEDDASVESVDEPNGNTNNDAAEPSPPGEFVATREWQTVKEGQAIPKGLHIRMNLQTGKKEAKLLDDEDQDQASSAVSVTQQADSEPEAGSRLTRMKVAIEQAIKDLEKRGTTEKEADQLKFWSDGSKQGMFNKDKKTFSRDELKAALKKFKAVRDDTTSAAESDEKVKKKFRSIDELKKDFDKLNMNIKTDVEILRDLLNEYNSSMLGEEDHVRLLTDAEYYVHQVDNAVDFANMGGLAMVIRDLNHTLESVRSEAAAVVSAATQSNPKIQVMAVDGGVITQFIRMLSVETSTGLRNRVLVALSSTIRHFPYAQQRFFELGGLQALVQLFTSNAVEKLQVKAVTLVNDLMLEHKFVEENLDPNNKAEAEKLIQYKKVPITEWLVERDWCGLVCGLLSVPEHDVREKVLSAMTTLIQPCQESFVAVTNQLSQLQREYVKLSQEELQENDDDQYFHGMLDTVNSVLSRLGGSIKDEL